MTLTAIEIELAAATGFALIGLATVIGMSIAAWRSRKWRLRRLREMELEQLRDDPEETEY